MMQNLLTILTELYYTHEENLGMILFSLISYAIVSIIAPYENELAVVFGETGVSVFYLVLIYFAYLIWATFKIYALSGKVKIGPIYSRETSKKPTQGGVVFAGLEVEIPENWEITNCYATIENAKLVYGKNHAKLDEGFSRWISDKNKPLYKRLRWRSPYALPDGRLAIGDNDNKEIFYVGEINVGISKIKSGNKDKSIDIRAFEFSLLDAPTNTFRFQSFGLYEVSILFHWNYHGRKMPAKRFDGYLYANVIPKDNYRDSIVLILVEGDYKKSEKISSLIAKEVKNVEQKDKTHPKENGGKKRKSSLRKTS